MDRRYAEHEHRDAATGSRRKHEQEQERRHGEKDVHRAHQQRVDERAGVAGHEADRCSDDVRDRRGEHGETDDAAASPEDAGEDVAAEAVGPEQELGVRSLEREADDGRRVVRSEERADGDQRDQQEAAREPGLAIAGAREAKADCERAHCAVLSFGTSSTTSRSASTFNAM